MNVAYHTYSTVFCKHSRSIVANIQDLLLRVHLSKFLWNFLEFRRISPQICENIDRGLFQFSEPSLHSTLPEGGRAARGRSLLFWNLCSFPFLGNDWSVSPLQALNSPSSRDFFRCLIFKNHVYSAEQTDLVLPCSKTYRLDEKFVDTWLIQPRTCS